MLGIVDIVLCRKYMYKCIEYDIPIEPHKTRGWSHPPFLIYALENLGSDETGGQQDQHRYPFV